MWLGRSILARDLVSETGGPFGYREVIAAGLAVDRQSRHAPSGSQLDEPLIDLRWSKLLGGCPSHEDGGELEPRDRAPP